MCITHEHHGAWKVRRLKGLHRFLYKNASHAMYYTARMLKQTQQIHPVMQSVCGLAQIKAANKRRQSSCCSKNTQNTTMLWHMVGMPATKT
jgi:hypothetical protein